MDPACQKAADPTGSGSSSQIYKQTFIELETAKLCEKNAQLEHRLLSFLRTNNSFACLCNGFFSSSKYSP